MEKLWMAREGHKQCNQYLLFGGLNLALPYTPTHKPGLSVSFIKICDRLDIAAAVKRVFLAAQEAWNHLVRVGITQMNKLWVGILILRKHPSLERERAKAAADSFSLSVPLLTASLHIHPLSSAPFIFAPLVVFCFFFLFGSHLIWPGNVLSCFSKHLGTQYSSTLPHKWDEGKPWGHVFYY